MTDLRDGIETESVSRRPRRAPRPAPSMRVPSLDLKPQLEQLGAEIKKSVNDVIDSTRYILGPVLEGFEKSMAEYVGVRHAVGASSGTDALLLALMALDVGPGDVVVTSPYSFFATAGCVARLGATPAFVDIDPDSYNLDPELLRDWFESDRERSARVKAIIPVHLFGQCAEMEPILALAERYGVAVIEDAAQAIGATYPASGQAAAQAGTMGDLGCFSFFPSKNLGAWGDGGMMVTQDEAVADRLARLRLHGGARQYHHDEVGTNSRLDTLQAAVLLAKLPFLADWSAARRRNAARYAEGLAGVAGVTVPATDPANEHTFHQYVIRAERRDALQAHLRAREVGTAVYYPLGLHLQPCFADLGYRPGSLPHTETATREALALPIYPELSAAQQDWVITSIRDFYA